MDNGVMENVIDNNQSQLENSSQIAEKMISQSQVNEIVGNAKREAAERAVENYKRQQAQSYQSQNSNNYESNLNKKVSEDDFRKIAGDEFRKHFNEIEKEFNERSNLEAAEKIVKKYSEKISNGKDKYQDFDSSYYRPSGEPVLKDYPNVVHMLSEYIDNAADVTYHLVKNRDKLDRIDSMRNPMDALYEIQRLSESIKANEQSSQLKNPNSPLSQQRPSNTSTDSGGSLSMNDLKRKYRV